MPIAFVRTHGSTTGSGSAGYPAATLKSPVAPGRTLVIASYGVQIGDDPNVTGWSRPGDETAVWVKIQDDTIIKNRAGQESVRAHTSLWAITTTVTWNTGQVITDTTPTVRDGGFGGFVALCETSGAAPITVLSTDASSLRQGTTVVARSTVNVRPGAMVFQVPGTVFGNAGSTVVSGGSASGVKFAMGTITDTAGMTAHEVQIGGNWTSTLETGSVNVSGGVIYAALSPANTAPNAPILSSPVDGVVLNRANTNRFTWQYSDIDFADTQSKADVRYRLIGAPSWTTVVVASPAGFYDAVGGTFVDGDYEWQVRTYDAQGLVGPWSPSEFFSAATAPAGPSITYPVNGQFVERDEILTWSSADQDAYQVRRVADDAGLPDPSIVYFDTEEVSNPATRSLPLTFETNARTEHVQLRVKNDGLFSPWSTVAVMVSYTPPPVPVMVLSADTSTASLLIQMVNPAPAGDEPAAVYNDIFIDDGDGEERKATMLPTNSFWRFWTPKSGRDYSTAVRVVAVAANGTTTSSEGI